MLKWWRMPLYPDWINAENTIIWLVTFQIQISNFQIQNRFHAFISLCVFTFVFAGFYKTCFLKPINIFVFFVFILVDAFRFPVFWFHKDREITKNLSSLAENNYGERKLSCTRLNFGEIIPGGMKRAVSGEQYRSILPARVGNQNTEFAA